MKLQSQLNVSYQQTRATGKLLDHWDAYWITQVPLPNIQHLVKNITTLQQLSVHNVAVARTHLDNISEARNSKF